MSLPGERTVLITDSSKRVIYLQKRDARVVGRGCYYLDSLVWLNGDGIELGDEVGFNIGCYVNGFGGLYIGDRSRFGPYTLIHTANHVVDDMTRPIWEQGWVKKTVHIGRDCWIGMGVCILPGVRVGDNAVIGAGSVVTTDIPANAIAVGNPCRVIRMRGGRK
jgi:acetyltransferase-like isoleucine patch superfamily enzyme